MTRFVTIAALFTAGLMASCAPLEGEDGPAPVSEDDAAYLAKQLEGKTPGEPVRCINATAAANFRPVSDDMLLLRQSGKLVYQNQLRGRCHGLARGNDIIVVRTFGNSYCSGDQIQLVDRVSGIPGSVCSLGDFIPYRKQ